MALAKYTPPPFVTRPFHIHTAPHISALSWYYLTFLFCRPGCTVPRLAEAVHQQCSWALSGFEYLSVLSHRKNWREIFLARRHCLTTVSTPVFIPSGNEHPHSGRICSSRESPLDWHSASRYMIAQNCGQRNSFPC